MLEVTCAIICSDNKVLVTQRSSKMNLPLKWEFPGGKIHAGETPEECILREIREELGISIKITKKLTNSVFDYGDFKICLIPFVCDFGGGNIVLAEHAQYIWCKPELLHTFDWADADKSIVNEFVALFDNAPQHI